MPCSVPYIQSSYKGNPELIQKLEQINSDIWDTINQSKLFREYGRERLFSKPKTEQFKKQQQLIREINRKYKAPTSLIHSRVTKSGYNSKVVVTVHPIAEQVWFETDAAKRLQDELSMGITPTGDSDTTLLSLAKGEQAKLEPIANKFDNDISEFNQYILRSQQIDRKQRHGDDIPQSDQDYIENSKFSKGYVFQLGKPSSILQSIGMPDLPITIGSTWFRDHIINNPEHNVKTLNFKGLVRAIQDPISIWKDKDFSGEDGRIVMATTIKGRDGKPVNVILEFKRRFGNLEVNSITTAYETHYPSAFIGATTSEKGNLLYVDKERITEYLQGFPHFTEIAYPKSISDSSTKVDKFLYKINNFKNPLTLEEQKVLHSIGKGQSWKTDPLVKQRYFGGKTTISTTESLENIANSNHPLASLAKMLQKYDFNPTTVELVPSSDILVDRGDSVMHANGLYNSGDRTIKIAEYAEFRGGDSAATILHEILHSLTYDQIHSGSARAQEFSKLYNAALEHKDIFRDKYPLTNEDEFLTGIFTNADFISQLKDIPGIAGIHSKNLWEQILDWFKLLFNMNDEQESLFEQAFAVGTNLIDDNAQEILYQKEFSAIPDEAFLASAGRQFAQEEENQNRTQQSQKSTATPEETFQKFDEEAKQIEKKEVVVDGEKIDRYFYKGKQIPKRVSDAVHNLYKHILDQNQMDKSDYQEAIDEDHRQKGTEGHADMEHLVSIMIDPATHKLVSQDQFEKADISDKYSPKTGNAEVYAKLKKNLWARLNDKTVFPEGTLFRAEMSMVNDTRKVADQMGGTVDLVAFSPDDRLGTKVSILDWKFIRLNTDHYADVPWYKIKAWRFQMDTYKKIMMEKYGIQANQFGQTGMIPIVAEYNTTYNEKTKKYTNTLTGIKIGEANSQDIADDEDYLLRVSTADESTGNKDIDALIAKLNSMYEKLSNKKVTEDERLDKALRLNSLFRAIRHLQIKQSLAPLVKEAFAINSDMQRVIDTYEEVFKNPTGPIEDSQITAYIQDSIDVMNNLNVMSSLNEYIGSIQTTLLQSDKEPDKKLYNDLNSAILAAGTLKRQMEDSTKEFVDQFVGKKYGDYDVLAPEKAVNFMKRQFKRSSTMPIATVQVLQRLADSVKQKADRDTLIKFGEIKSLEEEYLNSHKGLSNKDKFDPIRKKNKNELIDRYDIKFYREVESKAKSGDTDWIKDNIDWDAYKAYQLEQLSRNLAKIDRNPTFGTELINGKWQVVDNEAREQARQREINKFGAVLKDGKWTINESNKKSIIWKDIKAMKRFPLEKWESNEYKALKTDPTAFKVYNYILDLNKWLAEMGYIQTKDARTFLPYMRSSLVENMAMGVKPQIRKRLLESISVNDSAVGFGHIDPLTGEIENRIPAYFTTKIANEDTSKELFSNMLLLVHMASRYKYLTAVEGMVQGLSFVEKNKGALRLNRNNKVVFSKDDPDRPEVDSNNRVNIRVYEGVMRDLIYGQKYSGEDSMDAMIGNLYKIGQKVNKKLGKQIFPPLEESQNISFIKSIEGLNHFFYLLHLNPLNILSPISNYFGGSIQTIISSAGDTFSEADFGKALYKATVGRFDIANGLKAAEKNIKMIHYFMPYTEGVAYDLAAKLSTTKFNSTNVNNAFYYTMRGSDRKVQAATLLALLDNTIVYKGRLINVNDYVKGKQAYKDRYKTGNIKEIERNAKKEIAELKEKYSLTKLSKINDKGEFEIPGIDPKSPDIAEIRRMTERIASEGLGNMSESDTRGMNRSVITKSMMMFKNWIPNLIETRFGELNEIGGDNYEWGRVTNWLKFAGTDFLQSLKSLIGYSLANEKGIEAMRKLYQKEAESYRLRNGREWKMTEDQFFDMMRKNMKNDMKDLLITTSMLILFFGIKGMVPDKDEDPSIRTRHNFLVRTLDKLSDEVSFYYSPKGMTSVLSGGIFPSAGVLLNAERVVTHSLAEMYGLVTQNGQLTESNKPLKYVLRSLPFTKQMTDMLPLFAPDAAKSLGVRINPSNDVH